MDAVRKIAKEVRDKCLRFALSDDSKDRDYHGCEDLAMMCAVASTALALTLRQRKVDPDAVVVRGTYNHDCHCWVLSHGMIVDITASQFGLPAVVITDEDKGFGFWRPEEAGDPGKIATDWDGQSPSDEVMQKILSAA